MKNTILETQIKEYVDYRRRLGYHMVYHDRILRAFARFAASRGFHGPLKRIWAEEFVSVPRDVNAAYYRSRHRVLYDFARHWAAFDSRVEIPVRHTPQVGYRRPEPHIYSDSEVQSLMQAARSTVAGRPFVGETLAAVIGLMACTGIRKGEAFTLRQGDVDLEQAVIYVRRSKNRPLRLVPIHQTAAAGRCPTDS
jgi:integrase